MPDREVGLAMHTIVFVLEWSAIPWDDGLVVDAGNLIIRQLVVRIGIVHLGQRCKGKRMLSDMDRTLGLPPVIRFHADRDLSIGATARLDTSDRIV